MIMTAEEIKKIKDPQERGRLYTKYGYFGSISPEERAAALRGERIDHHLTEFEAINMCGYFDYNPEDFNKFGTPTSFSGLYMLRDDMELSLYYSSMAINMDFPENMRSDYREVESINLNDYK
jgi:hypothetical protein